LLTILQIITILQGLLLGFALFQRRGAYKRPVFSLFIGSIVSVMLFSIGDDTYNLLVNESRWFFFHEPLMITFFFLFVRYIHSEKDKFNIQDFLFFLPYLLYLSFTTISHMSQFEGNLILEIVDELIEFSFLGMLLYSLYEIISHQKNKWLLVFLIPFTSIYLIDTVSSLFSSPDESTLALDSYGIFMLTVLLFYFITYKLIISPKEILPTLDNKYKASKLSPATVEAVKKELNRLMNEEKLFKNPKLSANELADLLGIPRQHLSEILNIHMGLRFQDFLNQYRVEEFIIHLQQENYKHYTLLGIATEVGFSSGLSQKS